MPPLPESQYVEDTTISPDNLLCTVAEEIKTLRANTLQLTSESHSMFRKFPPVSQSILNSLPGNHRCVDCGNLHPEWATVTYGALLCIGCSGRHRRMGVNTSYVKSLTMDSWSDKEVLAMLEGGNKQLSDFFKRHSLIPSRSSVSCDKAYRQQYDRVYRTNAASFYKKNLSKHVDNIRESGDYRGRESYRNTPNKYGTKKIKNNNESLLPPSSTTEGLRRRVQVNA